MDGNELVGETDAMKWAEGWVERMTRLSPAQRSEFVTDQGTMVGWFANAIMAGYDQGRRDEQERSIVEKLREIIFQAAGAATRPLLEDHPDYVFPSERVAEAVEYVCASFGLANPDELPDPELLGTRAANLMTPEEVAAAEAAKLGTAGQNW